MHIHQWNLQVLHKPCKHITRNNTQSQMRLLVEVKVHVLIFESRTQKAEVYTIFNSKVVGFLLNKGSSTVAGNIAY